MSGTFSDGLKTNVLPHAIASGSIQSGTIAGKLNGVMPTATPSGCRIVWQSTPRDTCSSVSPMSSVGMPHENSTTSRPRCTDPRASSSVFPCSVTMSRATSSLCRSRRSR